MALMVDLLFEQNVEKPEPTPLQKEERKKAEKRGLPFCEIENRVTEVLFHGVHEKSNKIEEGCRLRGCCFPCLRKGVFHRVLHPGRTPPETHKVECTRAFHNYLYYWDLMDDDFLKDQPPSAISEETAKFLEGFVPDYEKGLGEVFYICP